jgi:hypothetical protein
MPSRVGSRTNRHSAGARVFSDDAGRLWSAAFARLESGWAVVFACITEARQPVRALALSDDDGRPAELSEPVLRVWLTHAPRIGPLT